MKNLSFIIASIILVVNPLNAQTFVGKQASDQITNASLVKKDPKNGNIQFIKFEQKQQTALRLQVVQPDLQTLLGTPKNFEFRKEKSFTDNMGEVHERYQQYYRGIKIEGMVFKKHIKNGNVRAVSGVYHRKSEPAHSADINYSEAVEIAKRVVPSNNYFSNQYDEEQVNELLYVVHNDKLILSYKIDIFSIDPLERYFVYINASTGAVYKKISRLHDTDIEGSAETRYSGIKTITSDSYNGSYRLRETGRGGGIFTYDMNTGTNYGSAVDFEDSDNYWDETSGFDDAAYDAHYNTELTYDYFLNEHGRNSFDNAGAPLVSYVHFDYAYVNAFWNGSFMTYGDGDGIDYFPLTSTDIVGHEITHGVTEYSANLVYQGESGALNESFSDIFGTCIDFYANPSTANWILGEQVSATNIPIRSMEDPNAQENPDTYHGNYWYFGAEDYGGVHTNSGVQNFWFYLLVNGGFGVNDIGNDYTVVGIGLEKAAQIAYRNLTVYLSMNSQYADARFYAIQSAIDLFGNCSEEVAAVTNAWYAVGVGDAYNDNIVADFKSPTYGCLVPAEIKFSQQCKNSTEYLWDFGDGNTSTDPNPLHTYTAQGTYTISLIAYNTGLCSDPDTIIKTDHIVIENTGGPVAPLLIPTAVTPGAYGVYSFELGEIFHSSKGSDEGYQDLSCNYQAILVEGGKYPITVYTSGGNQENVKVWIDFNNDGSFNAAEIIYQNTEDERHNNNVILPAGTVYNTPLRLRVQSDRYDFNINDNSSNPHYGQVEDYTVILNANTEKPIADIKSDKQVIEPGDSVRFFDFSENLPTSWMWILQGARVDTQFVQNPVAIYDSAGEYDVTLIVSNGYGSDTLLADNYIQVINSYHMCSSDSSTAHSGNLFDSGGPDGNYSNNESCSFLIQPNCADTIIFTIASINIESCCDALQLYDGDGPTGIHLGSFTGNSVPNPVIATSGSMYVRFLSDGFTAYDGFEAQWESRVAGGGAPTTAAFSVSDTFPPLNTKVLFTDLTYPEANSWSWSFDDGQISSIQSPTNVFSNPGLYNVSLIAEGCTGSDTAYLALTVQGAPELVLSPKKIIDSLFAGDSALHSLTIDNTAGYGDLVVDLDVQYTPEPEFENKAADIGFYADLTKKPLVNNYQFEDNNNTVSTIIGDSARFFANLPNEITGWVKIDEFLYILSLSGEAIYKYDIKDQEIVGSFGVHSTPIGMTYDGNNFWVGDPSGNAFGYDLDGNLIGSFSTPFNEYICLAYNGSHFLTTTTYNKNNIYVIDYDNTVVKEITNIDSQVQQFAINPSNNKELWVISDFGLNDYIFKTEVLESSIEIVDTLAFTLPNFGNAISIDNGTIYLASFEGTGFWTNIGSSYNNQWLELSENSKIVSAGSSEVIDLKLDANGLFAGDYTAMVYAHSNDMGNQLDSTFISLHVTGTAIINIVPGDSILFDTIFVGYKQNRELTIQNIGTDTLNIDSIYFKNSQLSAGYSDTVLAPMTNCILEIEFGPVTAGNWLDSIYFITNTPDGIIQIPVFSSALEPPVMEITPTSITVEAEIGDSITKEIIITNTGASALNYVIYTDNDQQAREVPVTLSKKKVRENPSNFLEMKNNSIKRKGQPLTSIFNFIGTTFKDDFEGPDKGWTIETFEGDAPWHVTETNFSSETHSWWCGFEETGTYDNGNQINTALVSPLINLSSVTSDSLFLIFSESFETELGWDFCMVDITTNNGLNWIPLRGEMGSAPSGSSGGWILTTSDISEYIGEQVKIRFYFNTGDGVGNNFAGWFIDDVTIASNRHDTYRIQLSKNEGTVNPSGTDTVKVLINTSVLSYAGIYENHVIINGNDPANESDSVDIQLTALGKPKIILSEQQIDFGSVFMNDSTTRFIHVFNNGTDVLEIQSVYNSNENYTLYITENNIAPYSNTYLWVSYKPSDAQVDLDTIIVKSNDPNNSEIRVALKGEALIPPAITVMPASLNYELLEGESTSASITINNTNGGSDLNYEMYVQSSQTLRKRVSPGINASNWISINGPNSGSVLSGNSQNIPFIVNTTGLLPGNYSTEIIISSNDPQNTVVSIPVDLTVIATPKLEFSMKNMDFGKVQVNNSKTINLIATNKGSDIITISDVGIAGDQFNIASFNEVILSPKNSGISPTENIISIDGLIDTEWDNIPWLGIENILQGSPDSTNLSAYWKALYNARNLYVLVEIRDNVLVTDSDDVWQDDGIELYLDGENNKASYYDSNDYQIQFRYGDPRVHLGNGISNGTHDSINFAMVTINDGYLLEVAVPWSFLEIDVEEGYQIGFDIHVNDDDDLNDRDNKLAWHAINDDSRHNPASFGSLTISGASEISIPVTFNPTYKGLIEDELTTYNSEVGYSQRIIELTGEGIDSTIAIVPQSETGVQYMTLYPNPANDEVYLKCNFEKELLVEIKIYNAIGALVYYEKDLRLPSNSGQHRLNLETLSKGIYQVVMRAEDIRVTTKKLIVE